jgi:LmbE family N-acetylglucosaminyl deacetylase
MMAARAQVKSDEVIRAWTILGLKKQTIHFFGEDDAVLMPRETTIRRLASLVRTLKPNLVLTHFPSEDGGVASPHAATGVIVMHALQLAAAVDPGDTCPPHKVAQVYFFGIGAAAVRRDLWGGVGGFTNDVFIDITDVIELKLAAIDAMASQGYGGAYARKRIETSDGSFGKCVDLPYAEGFISLRSTTHSHLPASEYDVRRTAMSDHESIARRSYRVDVKPSRRRSSAKGA